MAYNFALSYLNQYPSEKVGPSSFACDETIRNAKFESSLRALAVPVSDVEEPIFNALAEQQFTLHLDFINTAMPCTALSIVEVIESYTSPLSSVKCANATGILSASVVLPHHTMTVRAVLGDIQMVGGLRVGITGPGLDNDSYTLHKLNFRKAFYSVSADTLAQQATIQLGMTKVRDSCSDFGKRECRLCCRLSTRPSHCRMVNPSSEASGIRRSRATSTRFS